MMKYYECILYIVYIVTVGALCGSLYHYKLKSARLENQLRGEQIVKYFPREHYARFIYVPEDPLTIRHCSNCGAKYTQSLIEDEYINLEYCIECGAQFIFDTEEK